jgi:hypothetical protein
MTTGSQRLSPSFVVAVLALVLAAGGTGFAAGKIGSAQIKDNSVQGRDVENRTLTSRDIAKRSITRQSLDRRCGAGQVAVFGGCVRSAASGPTSYQAAIDDCSTRGGRLPILSELRWIAAHDEDFDWADGNPSQYEFSGDSDTSGVGATPIGMDRAGNLIDNAGAQLFWHHCVTY